MIKRLVSGRGLIFGVWFLLLSVSILVLISVLLKNSSSSLQDGYCSAVLQMCGRLPLVVAESLYNTVRISGVPILGFSLYLSMQVTSRLRTKQLLPYRTYLAVMTFALIIHWLLHLATPGYYIYLYDAQLTGLQLDYFVTIFPFYVIGLGLLDLMLRPIIRAKFNSV